MNIRLIGSILLLVFGFTCSAHAEKRVALVVGNSAYKNVTPLVQVRPLADREPGIPYDQTP